MYILDKYVCSVCKYDQYVGETVKSLRDRLNGHRKGMKNPFPDNRFKILSKNFGVGLCRNANYIVNVVEKLFGSGRAGNGITISDVFTYLFSFI